MAPVRVKTEPQPKPPVLKGVKRKRSEPEFSTKPVQNEKSGESLKVGRTIKYIVGPTEEHFDIHEKLATTNSPYLADMVKQPRLNESDPITFAYLAEWLYDKDGNFNYVLGKHFKKKNLPGYPYTPLIQVYIMAHKLRAAPFANAVLKKITQVHKETDMVADNHTIKYLYDQKLQGLEIHDLFVHQVAYYADANDLESYNNFVFVKAVLGQLPAIRDNKCPKHPPADAYYITEIDDPDDCIIVDGPSPPRPASRLSITPAPLSPSTSIIFESNTASTHTGKGTGNGRGESPLFVGE